MWVKAAMTNPIATGEKSYLLSKSSGFEVVNRHVYYPTYIVLLSPHCHELEVVNRYVSEKQLRQQIFS
jgi:hypothetical protein